MQNTPKNSVFVHQLFKVLALLIDWLSELMGKID
jgi:hypothetical protein